MSDDHLANRTLSPSFNSSFSLDPLLLNDGVPPADSALYELPRRALRGDSHSYSSRRPAPGPHGAPVPRQRFLGPCSVYLLVHQHDRRFKIGRSQAPVWRAQNLPEAPFIDWHNSLQVTFPNQSRASQIERMLHKALADFRLDLTLSHRAPWDGSTEWFAQSAFRHAINLLRVTPTAGDLSSLAQLLPLNQASVASSGASNDTAELRVLAPDDATTTLLAIQERQDNAAAYNLQQIGIVVELLTVLDWSLRIELHPCQTQPTPRPTIVRIHGLRDDWSEAIMQARFSVLDSERWALHTGYAVPKLQVVPLVRLMRYSTTSPQALELVVNDLKVIGRLPGGQDVVAQWTALCQRWT
jgi:Meiotically up-regulated gene 113